MFAPFDIVGWRADPPATVGRGEVVAHGSPMIITRFAPSPTGLLHLGHAYSALLNERFARRNAGRLLLRVEDIDVGRCRPEFAQAIRRDLDWLGVSFDGPIWEQADRLDVYGAALDRLRAGGFVYPDDRTRAELSTSTRPTDSRIREAVRAGRGVAWRLDLERTLQAVGLPTWTEMDEDGCTRVVPVTDSQLRGHGDVILARKDVPTSYHLAVCVDDAQQGITHVIRGLDLRDSTPLHRVLQNLLELPEPIYRHHRLVTDPKTGRRFAKTDHSVSLAALAQAGVTPAQIRERLGLAPAG